MNIVTNYIKQLLCAHACEVQILLHYPLTQNIYFTYMIA